MDRFRWLSVSLANQWNSNHSCLENINQQSIESLDEGIHILIGIVKRKPQYEILRIKIYSIINLLVLKRCLYWHHPSNSNTLRFICTVSHQDEQDWTLVSSMRKSQCQRLPLCHRCFNKNWPLSLQREGCVQLMIWYSHLIVHNVSGHTQPSLTDPGSKPNLKMQFCHDDWTVWSRSEFHSICRASCFYLSFRG